MAKRNPSKTDLQAEVEQLQEENDYLNSLLDKIYSLVTPEDEEGEEDSAFDEDDEDG